MSICMRCGQSFSCAMMGEQDGPCWCTAMPPALPVPGVGVSCWCPGCLKLEIEAQKGSEARPPHD
ncbi:MAG: cysteine-rich CWC family protein [Pseudomonadota bacterium]